MEGLKRGEMTNFVWILRISQEIPVVGVLSDVRGSPLAPAVVGESNRGLDLTEDLVGYLNRPLAGRWCQVKQVLGGSKKRADG